MPIFEIEKSDISDLSDTDLREIVARLCEAELVRGGYPASSVRWSGAQTAADAGLDVEIQVDTEAFKGDFVPRSWTGIQVKKPKMSAGKIKTEMTDKGELKPIISDIARAGGAYLIVSSLDDCTKKPLEDRRDAMTETVGEPLKKAVPVLDFYDRGHLANWLRQHPSVQLRVREMLGMPKTGWRPFGRWSATPHDADDSLICEPGLNVLMPGINESKRSIEDGINAVRDLVRSSGRAVRIAGLSGVGKSRFVQALFEDEIGNKPLSPQQAIYADLGDDIQPTATELLEQLIVLEHPVTLVLDNCPPDVHTRMATRIRQNGGKVKLITVEYDVGDNKPEATDVVRIDIEDGAIAEELVKRRHPEIGQVNTRTIAEFSGGNARVALALAERVHEGENLSDFSQKILFERLFEQRQGKDKSLLEAAEALALVYSFNSKIGDEPADRELAVLGSLIDQTPKQMYRAAETLRKRQLIQKRGDWRAVLPHAISNELARNALEKIPIPTILTAFEASENERLLRSFGNRLGYLHDNETAIEIVRGWLKGSGVLADLSELSSNNVTLLMNVAPVALEDILALFERHAENSAFASRDNKNFSRIVNVLIALAYDDRFFDRAVDVIVKFALTERPDDNYDSITHRLSNLFQQYLSGTHAFPERREALVRKMIFSADAADERLGVGMLEAALITDHWSGDSTFEFGARPRDYGYFSKNYDEQTAWYKRFLQVAHEGALSELKLVSAECRKLLPYKLTSLWRHKDLQSCLNDMARAIHDREPWIEGWRAVRSLLARRYRKMNAEERAALVALSDHLNPDTLVDQIEAHVLGSASGRWDLYDEVDDDDDDQNRYKKATMKGCAMAASLAVRAAKEPDVILELGSKLFDRHAAYGIEFGRELALQTADKMSLWETLFVIFEACGDSAKYSAILGGVIEGIYMSDSELANEILDEVVQSERGREIFMSLQTNYELDDRAIERISTVLDHHGTPLWQFQAIGWVRSFNIVTEAQIAALLQKLSRTPEGARIALDALSMRFHDVKNTELYPSLDFKRVALNIAIKSLDKLENDRDQSADYRLTSVLNICLWPDDLPEESHALCDRLIAACGADYGAARDLDDALALTIKRLPAYFLNSVMYGSLLEEHQLHRLFRGNFRDKNPLSDIGAEDLLRWCGEEDQSARFVFVAEKIDPFIADDTMTLGIGLSEQARRLIEAAPSTTEVLKHYVRASMPSSYSGRRSDVIEKRVAVLETLVGGLDERAQIDLRQRLDELAAKVGRYREMERESDEEREQSFE